MIHLDSILLISLLPLIYLLSCYVTIAMVSILISSPVLMGAHHSKSHTQVSCDPAAART